MPRPKSASKNLETVEPIGSRVLIRKDEDKKVTKVGIHLPDKIEIPTLTGRVVAISAQVANDEDYPIKQYDRVLFNPKHGIPVDFEGDNRLFVIPIEDVEKCAGLIAQAEFHKLPVGHFEVYAGEWFEKVADLEAEFLARTLVK